MNQNLEFEDEGLNPDSIEDNHPRTNYGAGYDLELDWNYLKEQKVLRIMKRKGIKEALRLYPECKFFILKQ